MISSSSLNKLFLEIMKKLKTQLKSSKPIQNINRQFPLLLISLSTHQSLDIDKWLLFFLNEISLTFMEIFLLKNKNSSEISFSLNTLSKLTFSSKKVLQPSSAFFFQLYKLKIGLNFKLFLMKPSDLHLNQLLRSFF